MSQLGDSMQVICAQHGFRCISISLHVYADGGTGFSAYCHWELESGCASGHGDTPDEAVRNAVAAATAKRSKEVMLDGALDEVAA